MDCKARLALNPFPPFRPDESMYDELDHGTKMADLVAGTVNGAHKQGAAFVPVKALSNGCKPTLIGWSWLINQIIEDISYRRSSGENVPAIINFSAEMWSESSLLPQYLTQYRTFAKNLFGYLLAEEIIFVAAAGQPKVWVTGTSPPPTMEFSQRASTQLGSFSNTQYPVIIVGGYTGNGPGTVSVAPGVFSYPSDSDYISVYGPYSQKSLDFQYNSGSRLGTSGATALVSGMIADWLSNPNVETHIRDNVAGANFPEKVRRFLISLSLTTNFKGGLNTPYNGYRDNPCAHAAPKASSVPRSIPKRDDQDPPIMVNGTIVDPSFYSGVTISYQLFFLV